MTRVVLLPLPETEWFQRDSDGKMVPLTSTDIVYSTDPQSTMRRVIDAAYAERGKTTEHLRINPAKGAA